MIELRNVRFSRGSTPILDGISFAVQTREHVAMLGGSGAGKTTLLRLIMGLIQPDSGSILIDGEDITRMNENELRTVRLKFTIVFQEGALFDSLTVKENVAFYLREYGAMREAEIDRAVREMLRVVGLDDVLDKMPNELSGGMKRRVAIARALVAQKPKMFLYDEPTADLDPINAENICRLMVQLTNGEKGFLMVTHEIIHALATADRFMFIRNGHLTFDGTRAEIVDPDNRQFREFVGKLYSPAVASSGKIHLK
jgi:phospholipid/cholesterol/gamma-HCH transport system ATP-binding protein